MHLPAGFPDAAVQFPPELCEAWCAIHTTAMPLAHTFVMAATSFSMLDWAVSKRHYGFSETVSGFLGGRF